MGENKWNGRMKVGEGEEEMGRRRKQRREERGKVGREGIIE